MLKPPPAKVPFRLSASALLRAFFATDKKHLIITGSIQSGKSTLLKDLITLMSSSSHANKTPFRPSPETKHSLLRSFVVRDEHPRVFLEYGERRALIGEYSETSEKMQLCEDGFLQLGLHAIADMKASDAPFCMIDELGFLETACLPFQEAVTSLLIEKPCIIVLRKQDTPFLNSICTRTDAFVYDLDAPLPDIGIIIMASGEGKRFGSNKLLYPFRGRPLISNILEAANLPFLKRIVVTRHREIEALCEKEHIPVLLHDRPYRNHTVYLGTKYLKSEHGSLFGYMYASSDQPLMTSETITSLSLILSAHPAAIVRPAFENTPGNPILFGSKYCDALMTLPDKKGGSFVAKKYPEKTIFLPVADRRELIDIDTPEDLAKLEN